MVETLKNWENDGLLDDTIVIVMSDHGILFLIIFIKNIYKKSLNKNLGHHW